MTRTPDESARLSGAESARCPASDDILAFAEGRLSPERIGPMEEHVDGCFDCQMLVAAVAELSSAEDVERTMGVSELPDGPTDDEVGSERGLVLGRYRMGPVLGAGTMGLVYSAYDPVLDRAVAVKVVSSGRSRSEQRRLLREAQALAKLQHPNVVAVLDVGEEDGRVFVAMEFVRGVTLREWLAAHPRGQREVLDIFLQAGAGLAAAHAHDLVHRDFKPDNVMLGNDGRVRVMDFGLATGRCHGDAGVVHPAEVCDEAFAATLTRSGTLVGTPAYMSPEQFEGRPAEPSSDQFAFCVALYEALTGERPFEGETFGAYRSNVCSGNVRLAADQRLPRWLRRTLFRGLEVERENRWPSMTVLLAELARDHRLVRRYVRGASLAGMVAAPLLWKQADADDACLRASHSLHASWDDDARRDVARAFSRTGLGYAPQNLERVAAELDSVAGQWQAAYAKLCMSDDSSRLPPAQVDAQRRCLNRVAHAFDATVAVLKTADTGVVERAVDVVRSLPSIERCSAASPSDALEPSDPSDAVVVDAVRRDLARAQAQIAAGQYEQARQSLASTHERLTLTRYIPAHLDWSLAKAQLHALRGEHDAAIEEYERVYFTSSSEGLAAQRTDAAIELVFLHGVRKAQPELAKRWVRHAQAQLEIEYDASRHAHLSGLMGSLHRQMGDHEAAIAAFEESLRLYEQIGPTAALSRAQKLNNLCAALLSYGALDRAALACDEALAIREEAYGDSHPWLGETLNNLGAIAYGRNDLHAAEELFERAAQIAFAAFGEDNPASARAFNNVGAILQAGGKRAEAAVAYERARKGWAASQGESHPDVGMALHNLGNVAPTPEARLDYYRRALVIREAALGPDHLDVGQTLNNIGAALLRMNDNEAALDAFLRALAIYERKLQPQNLQLAQLHFNVAGAFELLGRVTDAIHAYERAAASLDGVRGAASFAAKVHFRLAQTLMASKTARARSRALAEQALALLEQEEDAELRREIEDWLGTQKS